MKTMEMLHNNLKYPILDRIFLPSSMCNAHSNPPPSGFWKRVDWRLRIAPGGEKQLEFWVVVGAQLFLIYNNIMLVAHLIVFVMKIFNNKKSFINASFTTKCSENHDWWKLILKQNVKGYNFYKMNFSCLSLQNWEILSFVPAKELFFL